MMINKDRRIIVVEDMVRDVVIKDMEEQMSANSETCTSLMSTMKKESSFLLYTLRMLPYTTSMLDIVNILHVIILDK